LEETSNFKPFLWGGGGRGGGVKKHHPFPFDPDDSVVNEPQLAPGYTNVSFPKLGWDIAHPGKRDVL